MEWNSHCNVHILEPTGGALQKRFSRNNNLVWYSETWPPLRSSEPQQNGLFDRGLWRSKSTVQSTINIGI